MPMPSDVTGRLAMTKDSGEQSSFSTPFISEFNDIRNRYYQYFELVVLNSDSNTKNTNYEFHVYIKDKDYTEMDNQFTKGIDIRFTNTSVDCTYVNQDTSQLITLYNNTDTYFSNLSTSHISVISFVVYPETYDDKTFKNSVFGDERCQKLLVFVNGYNISTDGIHIPDSLVNNWSIGTTSITNDNFSYQWNFSDDRFIYKDLACQCYDSINQKDIDIGYNFLEYIQGKSFHNLYPYLLNSNDYKDRLTLEFTWYQMSNIGNDTDIAHVLIGDITPNTYFLNYDVYSDEEDIKGLLNKGLYIKFYLSDNNTLLNYKIYVKLSDTKIEKVCEISDPIHINYALTYTKFIFDSSDNNNLYIYEYTGDGVPSNVDPDGFAVVDLTTMIGITNPELYFSEYKDSINNVLILNNSKVQLSASAYSTKNKHINQDMVIIQNIEKKRDIFVSPNNSYWKSFFYNSRTYPFNVPLKNNPIFLPYNFSFLDENYNMYMEVTFGTNTTTTYYLYMGNGFKISTDSDPDTKTVSMKNGTLITFKNYVLNINNYENGVSVKNVLSNLTVSSNTIAFYHNCTKDEFGMYLDGIVHSYKNNTSLQFVRNYSYYKAVCIHAIPDNNGTDLGSIVINFGPDGFIYQDKANDLWEYDQYDKDFSIEFSGNFTYAQMDTSDLDDQSDYTISGTTNIGSIQVDEDDPNYIISGMLDYVSQFEIISVSIEPNTFETNIGEDTIINATVTITFDRIETFFGKYGEEDEFYNGIAILIMNNNATLVYVSHTDNTITFTYTNTVDTHDYQPGEYKYDVTITAQDMFQQSDRRTIADGITITIKGITYHKENKAQLHQFLSESGGGGLDKPSDIDPNDISIQRKDNFLSFDVDLTTSRNRVELSSSNSITNTWFNCIMSPSCKAFNEVTISYTDDSNSSNTLEFEENSIPNNDDTEFNPIEKMYINLSNTVNKVNNYTVNALFKDIFNKQYNLEWDIAVNCKNTDTFYISQKAQSQYIQASGTNSDQFVVDVYINCTYSNNSSIGTQYIIDRENNKTLGNIKAQFNLGSSTSSTATLVFANGTVDYSKSSDTQICYTIGGVVNCGYNLYSFTINFGNITVTDKYGNYDTINNLSLIFQINKVI